VCSLSVKSGLLLSKFELTYCLGFDFGDDGGLRIISSNKCSHDFEMDSTGIRNCVKHVSA
jgi:hypothetical protein